MSGRYGTGVGSDAQAHGYDSTALGHASVATADNSVALGANSVADRANSVSVGDATTGTTRQITNVARATHANDAVSLVQMEERFAQVNDRFERRFDTMDQRIDAIGAMGAAMAQMSASAAGIAADNRFAAGVGTLNGQTAVAAGFQRAFLDGRATFNLGGASTGDDTSFGAGVGFGW